MTARAHRMASGLATALLVAAVGLAGAPPTGAAPQAATAPAAAFTEPAACPWSGGHPVLRPGTSDPALRHLHCLLGLHGYVLAPYDGVYGPAFIATVKRFQAEHELAGGGVVDAATWEALHTFPSELST
ncbi:peptidoglycan-binding protein [Streptomyces sp. NPDC051677]|uniref:peptidoglycan-binding protein n=1 Tax=Streptomyces sp. NPDC051677 TaxID=3365669 RepID=UPI0037D2D75F